MTASSWVVIVASGKDEMLNAETCTAFLNLHSRPVLSYSLTAFEHCPDIEGVVIVAPRDRLEQVMSVVQLFGCHKVKKIVPGAPTQYASFQNGMKYVSEDAGVILLHEASRPILTAADVSELVKAARKGGYAVLGQASEEDTATSEGKGAALELHEPGRVWQLGCPWAISSEQLGKVESALKKKHKTVKTMTEAAHVAGILPKLVQAKTLFPYKIKSVANLQFLERLNLSA